MAPPPTNAARIAEANEVSKKDPSKAETIYKDVLSKAPGSNEQALRDYENALVGLGELYRDNKKVDELAELVKSSRLTLSSFAKAKTAKLGQRQQSLSYCHKLIYL
jgi:26S proteasome regulatory subunit RPN6 N-terminal domain